MKTRNAIVAAAAVGAAAWLLWPKPPARAPAAPPAPHAHAHGEEPALPAVPSAAAPLRDTELAGSLLRLPEGPATVAAPGPGDEAPSLPRDDAPPQENDPIEPELPQTPAWRRDKTLHAAALVDRQVARLDEQVAQAEASGDAGRARLLRVRADRQRKRLAAIREQAEALQAEALAAEDGAAP